MNRIEKIKLWKKEQVSGREQAEAEKKKEREAMLCKVNSLHGRIGELLAVANACRENGICVDEFITGEERPNCPGLVFGTADTDCAPYYEMKFMYVGFGGAFGKGLFMTDGMEAGYGERLDIVDRNAGYAFGRNRTIDPQDLSYFLGFFETFERRFYAYVDGVTAGCTGGDTGAPAGDEKSRVWLIINRAEEGRYALEGAYSSEGKAWARLDEINAREEGDEDYICLPVVVS